MMRRPLPALNFLINFLMGTRQEEAMKGHVAMNSARKANDKLISQSLALIATAVDELLVKAACMEELARVLIEDQTLAGFHASTEEAI
jgi:hypothetical protein